MDIQFHLMKNIDFKIFIADKQVNSPFLTGRFRIGTALVYLKH